MKNPLNPSGLVVIEKNAENVIESDIWQCPNTGSRMVEYEDAFFAEDVGLAYPKLRNVPILLKNSKIIASKYA